MGRQVVRQVNITIKDLQIIKIPQPLILGRFLKQVLSIDHQSMLNQKPFKNEVPKKINSQICLLQIKDLNNMQITTIRYYKVKNNSFSGLYNKVRKFYNSLKIRA